MAENGTDMLTSSEDGSLIFWKLENYELDLDYKSKDLSNS